MPALKISGLPAATTPLAGTEIVPLVQGGTTDRATVADFLKSAVAGTAAAPSFAFSADPNTGIFSPAADTFAVTTGGTERLRVTSAGDVGLGVTSPDGKFHVVKSTSGTVTASVNGNLGTFEDGSSNGISILVPDASTSLIMFGSPSSNRGAEIQWTYNSNVFQLGTRNVGGILELRSGNFALGATLDSSGNLGLGVAPSAWESTCRMLQLGAIGTVGRANSGQTQLGFNYFINTSNQYVYIQTLTALRYEQTGGEHRWLNAPSGTAGTTITFTQAMTLDASGNLGIGTSSPGVRLDVDGAFRGRGEGYFYGTGDRLNIFPLAAASGASILATNNANSAYAPLNLEGSIVKITIAGVEAARIVGAGNLGLGTTTFGTSAAKVFSIASGTEPSTGPADTVQFFSVDRSAGNTIPGIYCEGTGVTDAAITNVTVTNKIAIKVNGTVYYLLATTSAA